MMKLNLNKRETYSIAGALILLFLFIMVKFIVMPVIEEKERLDRSIRIKTIELADMNQLKAEYEGLRGEIEYATSQLKRKDKEFKLIAFLNQLAGSIGIQDKIGSMKPSSRTIPDSEIRMSVVELKLQEIDLRQLTAYLHGIETTPDMIFIRRMSINAEGARSGVMEVVLQVETAQL